jgi:uncharacterized protein YceH (UPF0502 family)
MGALLTPLRTAMTDQPLPDTLRLAPIEARILGCLIEKEATTPEQYPLTENAIVMACNQKTNREPVMELTPGEVGHALRQLEPRQLVRSVHGARAQRYEHRFDKHYSVTAPQQALLAMLLLRGPQTLHELIARAERLAKLGSAEDARHALDRLVEREHPLVLRLPRAPGQREERWAHLLCGPVDVAALASAPPRASRDEDGNALLARIEALEARLEALERALGNG